MLCIPQFRAFAFCLHPQPADKKAENIGFLELEFLCLYSEPFVCFNLRFQNIIKM